MRRFTVVVFVAIALSATLSACCTSLLCNTRSLAEKDLACDIGDLIIRNITYEAQKGSLDQKRIMSAKGCGKEARYSCTPTNYEEVYEQAKKKPTHRAALNLDWACQRADL